eukprot:TRINITY_DN15292_c0_g1_i1.p1 TRINITY_DN15292_c0_g1~~TRINITY_DN15292_c0_g1_i1.p1  ORF type:complete len:382 (-),score=46.63 TRINITY_DN15292_c0_g1_i1:225-1370(-)
MTGLGFGKNNLERYIPKLLPEDEADSSNFIYRDYDTLASKYYDDLESCDAFTALGKSIERFFRNPVSGAFNRVTRRKKQSKRRKKVVEDVSEDFDLEDLADSIVGFIQPLLFIIQGFLPGIAFWLAYSVHSVWNESKFLHDICPDIETYSVLFFTLSTLLSFSGLFRCRKILPFWNGGVLAPIEREYNNEPFWKSLPVIILILHVFTLFCTLLQTSLNTRLSLLPSSGDETCSSEWASSYFSNGIHFWIIIAWFRVIAMGFAWIFACKDLFSSLRQNPYSLLPTTHGPNHMRSAYTLPLMTYRPNPALQLAQSQASLLHQGSSNILTNTNTLLNASMSRSTLAPSGASGFISWKPGQNRTRNSSRVKLEKQEKKPLVGKKK